MKEETAREKYLNRSQSYLKKLAQHLFNAFVRNRDKNLPCISCGNYCHSLLNDNHQAGHLYPVKQFPWLALDEVNVNNQCEDCNVFKGGNYKEYRKGLINRVGEQAVKELDERAAIGKRGWKPDRFYYIDLIIKYR